MRIVITGASGNVGTALLRNLRDRDDEVVGIARRPPVGSSPYADLEWQAVDLSHPSATATLSRVFAGADAVVHLVWGFQPSHRPDYLEQVGVDGTARVLSAVATAAVPHVVHMSSIGTYSARRSTDPVAEEYPTNGVPSSPYSRHKAAAERLLDDFEAHAPTTTVTRLRPGIIGQRTMGSAVLRYAFPGLLPAALLRAVPVLPLDRRLRVQVVHADDVADAVVCVLDRRAGGAFNLAADPPVTAADVAGALGARLVPLPAGVLRAALATAWHARVAQLDPGWLDLAYSVPVLDTARARSVLDWRPTHSGPEVIAEVVAGMRDASSAPTSVLRPRSVADNLRQRLARGPVHERPRP